MSAALRVVARGDGQSVSLFVRAQPGAKRSGVVGTWNEHLKVAVRAPAEDGRANEELLGVLADALGLRASALAVLRGAKARQKEVLVPLAESIVRERLLRALEGA